MEYRFSRSHPSTYRAYVTWHSCEQIHLDGHFFVIRGGDCLAVQIWSYMARPVKIHWSSSATDASDIWGNIIDALEKYRTILPNFGMENNSKREGGEKKHKPKTVVRYWIYNLFILGYFGSLTGAIWPRPCAVPRKTTRSASGKGRSSRPSWAARWGSSRPSGSWGHPKGGWPKIASWGDNKLYPLVS